MNVKSLLPAIIRKNIDPAKLSELSVEQVAKDSGWAKRKARKIDAMVFVLSLFQCFGFGKVSYLMLAVSCCLSGGKRPSRQAVFKRCNARCLEMLERLVAKAMETGMGQVGPYAMSKLFASFSEVLVQDSTNFHLQDELFSRFPGNYSRGKRKALAKLDLVFDLKKWKIKQWSIHSFCQNDQGNASACFDRIRSGGLLIRDLGYFTLDALDEMNSRSIHFVSRLKNGVEIRCPKTKKKIALSKKLPKNRSFSMFVLLGKKQIPVRLVSIPLDQATVEHRVRISKKDRDRRNAPTEEKIARLSWAIFITSVPETIWSVQDVQKVYRVRWSIELIFKTWKGETPIVPALRNTQCSEERVRILITALILYSILLLWPALRTVWAINYGQPISWIKLMAIIPMIAWTQPENISIEQIAYYARYESRFRPNTNAWLGL